MDEPKNSTGSDADPTGPEAVEENAGAAVSGFPDSVRGRVGLADNSASAEPITASTSSRVASLAAALELHVNESARHLETLTEVAAQNKEQLSALRRLADQNTPKDEKGWVRRNLSIAVLLSIAGFLFGAFQWNVSENNREAADERQARAELTGIMNELAQIQSDFASESARLISSTLPETPQLLAAAQQLERRQILLAAARNVIDRRPEIVVGVDRLTLGLAFVNSGDYGNALQEFELAVESADDYLTYVQATRSAGGASFLVGEGGDEADRHYQAALDAGGLFADVAPQTLAFNDAVTHLRWSTALAYGGQCPEASVHIDAALAVLMGRPVREVAVYAQTMRSEGDFFFRNCAIATNAQRTLFLSLGIST